MDWARAHSVVTPNKAMSAAEIRDRAWRDIYFGINWESAAGRGHRFSQIDGRDGGLRFPGSMMNHQAEGPPPEARLAFPIRMPVGDRLLLVFGGNIEQRPGEVPKSGLILPQFSPYRL